MAHIISEGWEQMPQHRNVLDGSYYSWFISECREQRLSCFKKDPFYHCNITE